MERSVLERGLLPTSTTAQGEKIAVFDLDGTITYKDTYVDFLLFCLRKRPLRLLRGGELILYLLIYKAGFRSNHWLKGKYLGVVAGGLGGVELESICEAFCKITIKRNFKPKAITELNELRSKGYELVLATASFSFYVERLFSELQMDYLLCSKAQVNADGKITGEIDGKNCIGDEKARRLQQLCEAQLWSGVDRAYSDDIVDLPLFKMADNVYVVDPAAATEAKASELGYAVVAWR